MRPGYNPTRRSRNIGTAAQGHGNNNRLTIPRICQEDRIWWEQISDYQFSQHSIHGRETSFLIEKPHQGFIHACTILDVITVLNALPAEDLLGMETIVFRQSTKKQRTIAPVWGRLAYFAEIGRPARRDSRTGPAIFLEAINVAKTWKWPRSLDSDDQREVERLVKDGHELDDSGKFFKFRATKASARNTQLYRTLIHEVGHWVEWLQKVANPADGNFEEKCRLSDIYFARSGDEREIFAHRYAQTISGRLLKNGVIPFSPY